MPAGGAACRELPGRSATENARAADLLAFRCGYVSLRAARLQHRVAFGRAGVSALPEGRDRGATTGGRCRRRSWQAGATVPIALTPARVVAWTKRQAILRFRRQDNATSVDAELRVAILRTEGHRPRTGGRTSRRSMCRPRQRSIAGTSSRASWLVDHPRRPRAGRRPSGLPWGSTPPTEAAKRVLTTQRCWNARAGRDASLEPAEMLPSRVGERVLFVGTLFAGLGLSERVLTVDTEWARPPSDRRSWCR